MGKGNRQRRAAKQRERASNGRRAPQPSYDDQDGAELVGEALLHAADAVDRPEVLAERLRVLGGPSSGLPLAGVHQVAELVLAGRLGDLWRGGWQPDDLVQVTRRRLGAACQDLLVDIVAEESTRYARATLDPRWIDQLAEAGAAPDRRASIAGWAGRHGLDAEAGLRAVVELLALWMSLHPLPVLMPPPGTGRSTPRRGARPEDERALARVRGLLAKAEATEFPEEAEALSAKAQELMARHSLERLVVEAITDDREPVTARRLWIEAPYAAAKALLVQSVAQANRCRAVWTEQLGLVTVLGDERDLVATELLVTSLLVQATRAMVDRGRQADSRARSRSFRQSFLVAYATRIGDRLQGASAGVTQDVVASDLLPVLMADAERVEAARTAMFPGVVSRSVGVSDARGWAAGRVAADLARLDAQAAIDGGRRVAS